MNARRIVLGGTVLFFVAFLVLLPFYRWLGEHDPKAPPATPKSAHKSKLLHRWRQQNG